MTDEQLQELVDCCQVMADRLRIDATALETVLADFERHGGEVELDQASALAELRIAEEAFAKGAAAIASMQSSLDAAISTKED